MNLKKITVSDLRFFFLAYVFLYFSQFLIIFVPFRWYIPLFKDRTANHWESATDEKLLEVRKAMLRGLKYLPWRGKCLVQALTAKLLLRTVHLPGTIYFGIRKENDRMKAHAWLKCGDHFVSGKEGHKQFTVVQEIS